MANPSFTVNLSVTSAQVCMFSLKTQMCVTGLGTPSWNPLTSGNGLVYAQTGDVWRSIADLRDGAWIVLQGHGINDIVDGAPVTRRQQVCIQVNGSGQLRVKVSVAGVAGTGFIGGTPSPTQTPSAADEVYIYGGGTDASPTYETVWPSSGAWMQGRYDGTTDAVWAGTYPTGGGLLNGLFVIDPIVPSRDLSGGLVDHAPWVYYVRNGSPSVGTTFCSESTGPLGWLAYGIPDSPGAALWCRLPSALAATYDSAGALQVAIPNGLAQDPDLAAQSLPTADARYLRRRALSGAALGPKEQGNANTTGDKGPSQTPIGLCGVRSNLPTVMSVQPPSGAPVSTVVAVGDLLLPWEIGTALNY